MQTVLRYLQPRFQRKTFTGLPLTIIGISSAFIVATFYGLTDAVTSSDYITALDTHMTQFLFNHRTLFLDEVFFAITQFGGLYLVSALIIATLIFFYLQNKRSYIWPLVVTLSGAEATTTLIKLAIHRDRPGQSVAFYLEKSFSFPSGHATISMALYGFLIYFFLREWYRSNSSRIAARALMGLIILVGFSRIYLGVHYLSDVLAGYLVGALWVVFGISFKEWRARIK